MEDSGTILCQISSFKDMLDQINEEIEIEFERTREIESEIVKTAEIEKENLMRESELTKLNSIVGYELNGLILVAGSARKSVETMETEYKTLKLNLEDIMKRISAKREGFIVACNNFQRDIVAEENEDLLSLLSKKEALENEKSNLTMKINALRNSTTAFIEDILEELHTSCLGLEVEVECQKSENMELLKDIGELKTLLYSLNRVQMPKEVIRNSRETERSGRS